MKMINAEQAKTVCDMIIMGLPALFKNPEQQCKAVTEGEVLEYTTGMLQTLEDAIMGLPPIRCRRYGGMKRV